MNKRLNIVDPTHKNIKILVLIFSICFIGLFIVQIIFFNNNTKRNIDRNEKIISMTGDLVDNTFKQVQQLAQILLLNPDISRFIYQEQLEEGSSKIQTIIDARNELPFSKLLNSIIEDIYVYSRNSDYLLSGNNAFFDVDQMYDSMISFEGLTYLQWKNKYLASKIKFSFYPATTAKIDGTPKKVIPYVQTFPLNNTAENSGKILILLSEDYFLDLIDNLFLGSAGFAYMIDDSGNVITSRGKSSYIAQSINKIKNDGTTNIKIDGKTFFVSQKTGNIFPIRYVFAIDSSSFYSKPYIALSIIIFILFSLLLFSSIFSVRMVINSETVWQQLNDVINESGNEIPYEKMISYISTIVEEDREEVEQKGGTPYMKETFFRRLIHGDPMSKKEIETMCSEFDPELLNPNINYEMVRIVINGISGQLDNSEALSDVDFTRIVAYKQAYNTIGASHYIYMDRFFNLWLLCWNTDKKALETFFKNFSSLIPGSASMAISMEKTSIENIREATDECNEIMQIIFNENLSNRILYYGQISSRNDSYIYSKITEKQLLESCFQGDIEGLEKILSLIEKRNFIERKLDIKQLQLLMEHLYQTALKVPSETKINNFENFQDVKNFFISSAERIIKNLENRDECKAQKIKIYVSKHYMDSSLTLSKIASDFDVKENCLYHFMNSKMQCTFAKYLEKYRLEKASEMLSKGNESIVDIAKACGYSNPQTFRRAFKKYYCMVPSDYRTAREE